MCTPWKRNKTSVNRNSFITTKGEFVTQQEVTEFHETPEHQHQIKPSTSRHKQRAVLENLDSDFTW